MSLDWMGILEKLIVAGVVGGGGAIISGGTWLITTVIQLKRDMNAAFCKIRQLEGTGNEQSSRQSD